MRHVLSRVLLASSALALSGCGLLAPKAALPDLGRDTQTEAAAPSAFAAPQVVGSWEPIEPATLTRLSLTSSTTPWHDGLTIPALDWAMHEAFAANPNLQTMEARLTQARALAREAMAAQLPSIAASADAMRGRQAPSQSGSTPREATRYGAGAAASFEVDLFGGVFLEGRAARFSSRAQQAMLDDAKRLLAGEVVKAVVLAKTMHDNLALWQQMVAASETIHAANERRFALGETDVAARQASVRTLQSLRTQALEAEQASRAATSALAVLLGQLPQGFELPAALRDGTLGPAPRVPENLTSVQLLERPDIRAAALRLMAANDSIGAARAAFLPKISLTGSGGFASGDASDLFNWSARTWSAGPVVSLPIFQGGALRANLMRSWGAYEEAVAQYRGVVLTAFKDVQDALNAEQTRALQHQSAQSSFKAAQVTAQAFEKRLALGDISRPDLLQAKLDALTAQVQANLAHAEQYLALAGAMQALAHR